jgi:adenosylhomocysteinase
MPYIKFNISRKRSDAVTSFLRSSLPAVEYEKFPTRDPKSTGVKIYLDNFRQFSRVKRMKDDLGLTEQDIWDEAFDLTMDSMPILKWLADEYEATKPFEGKTIVINTHLKENTAVLCYTLKRGGADLAIVPVPYSGDELVYDVLKENDYKIYGEARMNYEEIEIAIENALSEKDVDIILEDGLWITRHVIEQKFNPVNIIGSVEQTKAGVNLASELREKLGYPVITVGNAKLKELAESGLATPEAVVKMILQAANWSLAGKTLTIVGYGPVGSGIAKIARSHSARVYIVEKDTMRVLNAILDGFEVYKLSSAIANSDILVTATGKKEVVSVDALKIAKDGILLVNAGSKDYEVDVKGLRELAETEKITSREGLKKYFIKGEEGEKKMLLVAADGFPINLSLGEGTPSDAIDITLCLMAEAAKYLVDERFTPGLHKLPKEIQEKVAQIKLESVGYSF